MAENVKPLGANQVREMYDKGKKYIEPEVQRYWVNQSYLYGEQWVYYNQSHNRLEQLPRSDPKRVRATVNRLRPETRRLMAKMLKNPLQFSVAPTGADDESVMGSRLASQVLADYAYEQDWERIRREHAYATWTGGTGLLCLDWNPEKGDRIEGTAMGDIEVTPLSVAEAVTVAGARDIERGPWWIKAQALPPEVVKDHFGLKDEPQADAMSTMGPAQNRIISGDKAKSAPLSLVLTLYERPSPDVPQGRVIVVVGNQKIAEGPWPFPFTDRLNVVCAREMIGPGRWTGDTVFSDAVPIQTAYNACWSSIIEHQKLAGNARLMIPDVSMDLIDMLTDAPGEIVPYNSQAGAPGYLMPGQMPQWWIEMPTRLERAMDDALASNDVSRGQAPPNIESGLGISILVEQSDTPSSGLARELAGAWMRLATMVLETVAVKVTEPRTARVHYPNQPDETVHWTGKHLAGQTRAYIPADAVAPLSDEAKAAKGFNLWDRKVITDPRALAAYINLDHDANFIEATDPDVAKARRENHLLALGEPVVPEQFDNHETHVLEHNRFRKTDRYERLDDGARSNVDKHLQAHEVLAAEEMGKQVGRAANVPALGAAAQAHQPPGSPGGPPMPDAALNASAQVDAEQAMADMQAEADQATQEAMAAQQDAMNQQLPPGASA